MNNKNNEIEIENDAPNYEGFDDGSQGNSGDVLNKGKFKLKFYLDLASVIILGILLIICAISLFVPLDIPGWYSSNNGFLASIFLFDELDIYYLVNSVLILIPFGILVKELISFLKHRKISTTGPFFFIGIAILLFLIDKSLEFLSGTCVALLVLGIVLAIGYIAIYVFCLIKYSEKKITVRNIIHAGICLASLIVVSILPSIDFKIIGFSGAYASTSSLSAFIADAKQYLIYSDLNAYVFYIALLFSILILITYALFIKTIKSFLTNDKEYGPNSKIVSLLAFIFCSVFFVFTIVNRIAISLGYDFEVSGGLGSTFIPLLLSGLLLILQCFFIGKKPLSNDEKEAEEDKVDYNKLYPSLKETILSVSFCVAIFGCFLVSFFLKFLIIDGFESGLNFYQDFSCYSIITDNSGNLGGLPILGFIFITFLTANITLLVFSLCSILSKSKTFGSVTRTYVVFCFVSIFSLWIISNYYLVFMKTTPSFIEELIPEVVFLYPSLDEGGVSFTVSNELLVPFICSAAFVVAFIILKPITKLENILCKKQMAMEMDLGKDYGGGKARRSNNYASKNAADDDIGKVSLVEDDTTTFDNCPAFTELDNKIEMFDKLLKQGQASAFKNLSLPSLVEFVVDYAKNSRLHLSYSKKDIATFVAGLGACKLSILQGMSGTGKTSLPKIFLEALMGNCEIVEVESSWRDKNELLGFYNDFSKVYSPKKFTRALYKAALNPNIITFIVLDEMNLSRIEYYFSDFLSLMENEEDKREIRLTNATLFNTYDGEKHSYKALKENHTIVIPKNIWFIGTANRDESTFEISDKVYDRGYTMNFDKRAPAITDFDEEMKPQFVDYSLLRNLFKNAPSVGFSIEKCTQILECEKLLRPYNISFGNRIAKQIEEFVKIYCNCFREPSKHIDEAVETILLSKVVHKLEYKNVTNKAELIHAFKKLNLFKCVEFIETLSEDF